MIRALIGSILGGFVTAALTALAVRLIAPTLVYSPIPVLAVGVGAGITAGLLLRSTGGHRAKVKSF